MFQVPQERPKVPHGTVTHDELLELEASDRAMHAEEVMALRISLKEKDEDLAQLKRDMHEDMVRELEQAQLAEEGTEMYAFELDCMTERAEHLAAQVTESRLDGYALDTVVSFLVFFRGRFGSGLKFQSVSCRAGQAGDFTSLSLFLRG